MKVRIMGKEAQPYVDRETGEAKVSKTVYVEELHDGPVSGLTGTRGYPIKANAKHLNFEGIKEGGVYIISTDTSNYNGKKEKKLTDIYEVKA